MFRLPPSLADPVLVSTDKRDDGCVVAAACLDCPLPSCLYDLHPRIRQGLITAVQVRLLRAERKNQVEIARLLGITPRTVYRALRWRFPE